MWRIMGLLFFDNKHHFETKNNKQFDKERIIEFCTATGIALYDTACEVRRLKDNASDKFLEIITATNLSTLLEQMPQCQAIVTTGQKATDTIVSTHSCKEPAIGKYETIYINEREIHFWRMPSTSRAYPLAIDKKALFYRDMLVAEKLL